MKIRSTKRQRDFVKQCHIGVGFMLYRYNEHETCELEFFIKGGVPHYIANGEPVKFDCIQDELEESR